MIGHKPKTVLMHIMCGARCDKQLLDALKFFKCDECPKEVQLPKPVKMPSFYAFNYEVIIDVFESKDDNGERYSWLSIVCDGTTFHIVCLVRVGGGQPRSTK